MCGTTPSRPTHPRPPRYPHPPAASPRLRSSPRCPAPPTRWPSLAFACHLPRPRVRSRLLPQRRPGWPLSLLRRPTTPHRPATTASAHQLSAAPLVARSAAACLPSQWLCAVCDGAAVSSASQSRHRCRRTCSSPRVERNRSRGRSTCCTMRMESSERGVCFLSGFRIDYFVNNKSLLLIYLDDVLDANTGTVYAYAQSESRNQSTDGLMVITQLLLADLFPPMAVSPCGSLPGAPSAHARLGFSSGASSRRGSGADHTHRPPSFRFVMQVSHSCIYIRRRLRHRSVVASAGVAGPERHAWVPVPCVPFRVCGASSEAGAQDEAPGDASVSTCKAAALCGLPQPVRAPGWKRAPHPV